MIGRQKIGLYSNGSEFQHYINNWLLTYISSDLETPLHLKHRYPLLDGKVKVVEDHFLKNNFICMIYLKPHLVSVQIAADVVLKTNLISNGLDIT
jgi:predicted component of type VI protein secretion system